MPGHNGICLTPVEFIHRLRKNKQQEDYENRQKGGKTKLGIQIKTNKPSRVGLKETSRKE